MLGRRYPLNKSQTTWLEIGIDILPEPTVQIALINKRRQEVILSQSAWYGLIHLREKIMSYLSDDDKATPPDDRLDNVTLIYNKVNGKSAICFHMSDEEVCILRETCLKLFYLQYAVANVVNHLEQQLGIVRERLAVFKNIIQGIMPAPKDMGQTNPYKLIVGDKRFNKDCIVDTELAVLGLEAILCHAWYRHK